MVIQHKFFLPATVWLLASVAVADTAVEHRVQRGDVALVYESQGKGDPVILLAGGPGVTPYSVKPVQDLVALNHQAVLVHQRGTGKTALPSTSRAHLSLPIFIEDIDAVRRDLHADKVTLIGHSWGGMLAMAYAAAHPDRVSHLVLMDSGGVNLSFTGVFTDNIMMRLQPEDFVMQKRSNDEAKSDPRMSAFHYLLSILPGYFYRRETAIAFEKTLKPDDYNPALRPLLARYDVTKTIGKYRGPVDIIQGRQDPIDASTVSLNVKYLPQAKVHWIERAGHIPWLEEPADFEATIKSVLAA